MTPTKIALFVCLVVSNVGYGQRIETIASAGEQAPGLPTGVVFQDFAIPSINKFGEVCFLADFNTSSPEVNGDSDGCVWMSGLNGLRLLAREGGQAPGQAAGVIFAGNFFSTGFGGFTDPVISDTGSVVFQANLAGTGATNTNRESIWKGERDGTASLVVRRNSGIPDFEFLPSPFYAISSSGALVFIGRLDNGGIDGIWMFHNEELVPLVQEDDLAPGTSTNFGPFSNTRRPRINARNQVVFTNTLDFGIDSVWMINGEELNLIARENQQADDIEDGVFYDGVSIQAPEITEDGRVGFRASLSGNVASDRNFAVWAGTPGNLQVIAREGELAPGLNGETFRSFSNLVLASNERVGFSANIGNDSNDDGVFAGLAKDFSILAFEGDLLPSIGTFQIDQVTSPLVNKNGQTVFMARDSTTDGVFIAGPNGDIELIVQDGQQVNGGSVSNLGELTSLWRESTPEQGSLTGINEFGQVAMNFDIGGAEGIHVYTPGAKFDGQPGNNLWESSTTWRLGICPGLPHDVCIDPDFDVLIIGPTENTSVRCIEFGTGSGQTELNFQATGTVAISNGMIVGSNGILSGNCTLNGNVTNMGIVALGDSAGGGVINGSYEQTELGSFEVEIGGLTPIAEHDFLEVRGDATIDGNLSVSLTNQFKLPVSEVIEIVDCSGNLIGQFDGLSNGSLVGNFQGADLFISYNGGDGNDVVLYTRAILGDVNEDGETNLLDVAPFVEVLTRQLFVPEADINTDGVVNLLDVASFVVLLTS